MQKSSDRRILSIDGGGIKGIFPLSFLSEVEDTIKAPIVDFFDLIVGTSTGGIIALGLGLGYSARDLLGFYEELGPTVFAGSKLLRAIRTIGISRYESRPLKSALETKFGTRKIGESRVRLVIAATNLETGEVHLYKTAHHPRFERDYGLTAVEAALATAAAPVYFPTYRNAVGIPLIDGGVWAINPIAVAAVEAVGVLGWPPGSFRILSLGCTTSPFNFGLARRIGLGLIPWAFHVTQVFLTTQSTGALGMASVLAGHENIMRINPMMPSGRFEMDKVSEIGSLRGLGASEARKALPTLRRTFLESQAEQFQPYRSI